MTTCLNYNSQTLKHKNGGICPRKCKNFFFSIFLLFYFSNLNNDEKLNLHSVFFKSNYECRNNFHALVDALCNKFKREKY